MKINKEYLKQQYLKENQIDLGDAKIVDPEKSAEKLFSK